MAGQLSSLGSSYPWKALAYIPSSCNVVVRLSLNNHWLQQQQNQAMVYNIYFPPDNISVAGPSVLPSGNNTPGQT